MACVLCLDSGYKQTGETDRQTEEAAQRQEHPTARYEQEAVVGNSPFMSSLYRTAHFDQTISVKPPSSLLSG